MNKKIIPLIYTFCYLLFMFNIYLKVNVIKRNSEYINGKENNISMHYDSVIYTDNIDALEIFYGQLTAYGADCRGCSGITAQGYDIRNNNIYYKDKEFGEIRIVAADKKYKFGTIVRISNLIYSKEPIVAVVLDRGFVIKGDIMDLAFDSEKNLEVKKLGRERNAKFEILRYGW